MLMPMVLLEYLKVKGPVFTKRNTVCVFEWGEIELVMINQSAVCSDY